jgi:hypothetical protein
MEKETKKIYDEIIKSIYPIVIVADRYGGMYSRGKYTAWNCYIDEVPIEIDGDDMECYEFWYEVIKNGYVFKKYDNLGNCKDVHIGIGETPEKAIFDLYYKLEKEIDTLNFNFIKNLLLTNGYLKEFYFNSDENSNEQILFCLNILNEIKRKIEQMKHIQHIFDIEPDIKFVTLSELPFLILSKYKQLPKDLNFKDIDKYYDKNAVYLWDVYDINNIRCFKIDLSEDNYFKIQKIL